MTDAERIERIRKACADYDIQVSYFASCNFLLEKLDTFEAQTATNVGVVMALQAQAAQHKAECERLNEAMVLYGGHLYGCSAFIPGKIVASLSRPCNCGFDAIFEAAVAATTDQQPASKETPDG